MNTYIRNRIRIDAQYLVARAKAEHQIVHKGLRGRFREILVDAILAPWLPPYAGCATGMIVDIDDRVRESTQEDIVIFDRSLVPAVLTHSSTMEGLFPLDGALARIEVKSVLTRTELRNAVLAAREIYDMKFCGPKGCFSTLPIGAVFAYSSDLRGKPDKELKRLLSIVEECELHFKHPCDASPGPIVALCIIGRGCWCYGSAGGSEAAWLQAKIVAEFDEIVHFVGVMSNSCFAVHQDRLGMLKHPERGAGGGIGNFILTNDTYEKSLVQFP